MATATEIATRALKRISVIGAGETLSAAELSDAKEALNAMLASFETLSLSGDVLPLDARFEAGIVAMLAERLAEDYGKQVGPVLARDAENGRKALSAAFFAVPESTFESGLKYSGPDSVIGTILSCSNLPVSQWAASREYVLRDTVVNNALIYECTTAGTSAASGGPTGTGSDIADGTAVWVFRRVEGKEAA